MAASMSSPTFKPLSVAKTSNIDTKNDSFSINFSSFKPLFFSLSSHYKKNLSLIPLVAQTSEFARQQEGNEFEVGQDDAFDWPQGITELSEEAKLYVGNLPYEMDSEKLAELFNKAGVVALSEVIYNRETGRSRGFGFVTMSTIEEAENAIQMLHRYEVNERLLTVNKATPRGGRVERTVRPSFRVFVGNLPWKVDDAQLEQIFSEHGKVLNRRVQYDRESGRSRGFGFVSMSSQSEMDSAIAALDGYSLDGRALQVNAADAGRPRDAS